MSRRQSGFTRASSLGPIADVVDRQGGSIARLLRDVDLPFALLESPETLLPLREQFRLLERAARATGDAHFGARLGQHVSMSKLSAFGKWVGQAATLKEAIGRAHLGLNGMLQTSTVLALTHHGPLVTWSIEFLDPECDGRYQNELLGASYMIDCVRAFAGPRWTPNFVWTTAARGSAKAAVEQIFRADVSTGHAVTTIAFDAALLGNTNRNSPVSKRDGASTSNEPALPAEEDAVGATTAVMALALKEGSPRLEWVAAKLGTTPRSLQRKLAHAGTAYVTVLEDLLRERSTHLISTTHMPITEIALELGYSDSAHFTRAFRRWTGLSPMAFRKGLS